jgi:acyl-CoA synthetase (AMP-forming)/AMP-acid ligase II
MVAFLVDKIMKNVQTRSDHTALIFPTSNRHVKPGFEAYSYKDLGQCIERHGQQLGKMGFKAGDRILVALPLSLELYAMILAILQRGMTVVFLDRQIKLKSYQSIIRGANLAGIVVSPNRRILKLLLPALWSWKWTSLGSSVGAIHFRGRPRETPTVEFAHDQEALISYTSGTTGTPKGANRTHDILSHQHRILSDELKDLPDEVDMSCFPVFVLHNLACGTTSVAPDFILGKPAEMDPESVVRQITAHHVTRIGAAPAFIDKLASYVLKHDLSVPSVRSVIVGGAPVSKKLCVKIIKAFPAAHPIVVYGSTEAEPIAHIAMKDLIGEDGLGYLVGKPSSHVDFKVLPAKDKGTAPTSTEIEAAPLARECEGELLVKGPHVLREYLDNHPDNRSTKIKSADGLVWHRTKDIGFVDAKGQIWLRGRIEDQISHNGQLINPFTVEAKINDLEDVKHCALLKPFNTLYLVFASDQTDLARTKTTVATILADLAIEDCHVLSVPSIPTDHRHNSKVDRTELTKRYLRSHK